MNTTHATRNSPQHDTIFGAIILRQRDVNFGEDKECNEGPKECPCCLSPREGWRGLHVCSTGLDQSALDLIGNPVNFVGEPTNTHVAIDHGQSIAIIFL